MRVQAGPRGQIQKSRGMTKNPPFVPISVISVFVLEHLGRWRSLFGGTRSDLILGTMHLQVLIPASAAGLPLASGV